MEMKKKMKKVLSLVLILTMIMATWIGAMPSQAVQAATKPALNKTSVNVLVGKSTKLKLKKKITGAKISWKSKNKKIATVVKSGKVTGVRKGNTKITANVSVSGKKYKLNCKVKVVQKAKNIQITYNNGKTASPIELKVGGKIQLSAKPTSPKGSNDYISSWKSKSGKIATVNKKGEVVAVAAGETTITATAFGKAKASIKVKVVGNNVTPSPTPTLKPTPTSSVEPSASPSPGGDASPTPGGDASPTPEGLKGAYEGLGIPIGTAINNWTFSNEDVKKHILEQYNSFTLENEMKPDAILGLNQRISVEQAKADGYVIPDNYKEATVPKLNFDTIDKVLKSAYDNGLKMRAHTLVWHSQTPAWFFNKDYSSSGTTLVSQTEMDARMEFYIRTVMKHVYDSEYSIGKDGEVIVYAWDVVNEYLNNNGRGWTQVYGDQKGNASPKPAFVKKAFTIAKDVINEYEFGDGIGLFYNDFNTYDNTTKIVNMIKYINESGKVCDGVGMQCHLDVDYPTVNKVGSTIDAFKNAGFEIQITELDVTINFDYTKPNLYRDKGQTNEQQAVYFGNLMKMLIQKKMGGANITGITWWGLYDAVSWRRVCQPLLFGSNINDPKPSYSAVIEAASIIGGQ